MQNAASDLGLHCLPSVLLRVSRLKWVKIPCEIEADDTKSLINFCLFLFSFIFYREIKMAFVNKRCQALFSLIIIIIIM